MKLIGMSIIIISTSSFGVIVNLIHNKRIKDLNQFKTILNYLKNEINYALTPISDALEIVCKKDNNDMTIFFKEYNDLLRSKNQGHIHEIDNGQICHMLEMTCLNDGDIVEVSDFLSKLGSIDKESQLNQINLMMDNQSEKIKELKENNEKNQKLYKTMGVMFGALVIIMFL